MLVLSRKTAIALAVCFVLMLGTLVTVVAQAPVDPAVVAQEYLAKLGWEVLKSSVQVNDVQLPETFTPVYNNFNSLQQEAGFDLTPYKGKKVQRVVYAIENFDGDPNVISETFVFNNKIVGGDLLDPSVDNGFNLPLLSREEIMKINPSGQ